MAQLPAQFDASDVEPRHPNEVRPSGWYACFISNSEMKPTKDATTEYLQFEYTVYEPAEFAGAKFFDNLNINHDNPVVQEIAYKTLSAICHATGVMVISDTAELHDNGLAIRVAYVPPEEGKDGRDYPAKNEVKDYRPVEEVTIGITAEIPQEKPAAAKAEAPAKKAFTPPAKATPPAAKAPVTKTPIKKAAPVAEPEEAAEEAAPVGKAVPPWMKKKA